MKEKKKVDFVRILVYIAMVLLVAVIVLPPVLRLLLPKDNVVEPMEQEKVEALMCNKTTEIDTVPITIKTISNYLNDNLNKVSLTYTIVTTEGTTTVNPFESLDEVKSLKEVANIDFTEDEQTLKFSINKNLFKENMDNEFLQKYNQLLNDQKTFFEEQDYSCQVITN